MESYLEAYRKLTQKLGELRTKNNGEDSPEEEALLDRMTYVWDLMDGAEKAEANAWPPLDAPVTWTTKHG
jgi:hypothetical protein